MNTPAPLLFTACDTGSANFIMPVLPLLRTPYKIWAQKQAAEAFERQGIAFERAPTVAWDELERAGESLFGDRRFSRVVCGTSWGSSVDKAATLVARKRGIRSVGIVEHWSLYKERFAKITSGAPEEPPAYLPDEIWVNDETARTDAIAAGHEPSRVIAVGQPHLERSYLAAVANECAGGARDERVVFMSERVRDDFVAGSPLDMGFDEYQALEILIEAMDFRRHELVIKLHPQEPDDKYSEFKNRGLPIEVIKRCDLAALLAGSWKITGMVSMVLLEAALIRPDVISIFPAPRPERFIGNKIGATVSVASSAALRPLLQADAAARGLPFGKRFLGSAERIAQLLEEPLR